MLKLKQPSKLSKIMHIPIKEWLSEGFKEITVYKINDSNEPLIKPKFSQYVLNTFLNHTVLICYSN